MDGGRTNAPARPEVIAAPSAAGRHRLPAPPNALRGRAAVLAVAAGAAVSAASAGSFLHDDQGTTTASDVQDTGSDRIALLANGDTESAPAPVAADSGPTPSAPEAVAAEYSGTPGDSFFDSLVAGTQLNVQREIAEEQARRPRVVLPAHGTYTSKYEMRWGSFHGGIDLAGPEGTPEFAATDGTVIDAGPAQGFGQWVRIMSDDGVMTVYGHMNTVLVQKGMRVIAGQPIALMGSQGFSTGSHLHFEVWVNNGTERTDPAAWLLSKGIDVGPYGG